MQVNGGIVDSGIEGEAQDLGDKRVVHLTTGLDNPVPGKSTTQAVFVGVVVSIRTGDCAPYAISFLDHFNNAVAVRRDSPLTLSGAASGTFYADAGCAMPAASTITVDPIGRKMYWSWEDRVNGTGVIQWIAFKKHRLLF